MEDHGFDTDFIWGASTSAYQIEGGAQEGGKGESIWDRFTHIPGNINGDENGDIACDCYHRTAEDVALMKKLGLKAYRFSISWSRIMPDGRGTVSAEGLAYYDQLVDALAQADIEAYVTLYHWDLPQKLQDRGGWCNRETAVCFTDYCRVIFEHFGKRVRHWITLNEPWVVAFLGHYTGEMAPGIRDFSAALQAAHVQLLAHGMAVQAFRRMKAEGRTGGEIGIVLNLSPKAALYDNAENQEAAIQFDGYANRWFLDPLFYGKYPEDIWQLYRSKGLTLPEIREGDMSLISQPMDLIGFNYYNIDYCIKDKSAWPLELKTGFSGGNPVTHYRMPIVPDGLEQILLRLQKEYHPEKILVTENGASFQDIPDRKGKVPDEYRIDYLDRHLRACRHALQQGVPLKGYFVWSLFDNFEWNTGYENQFGLIYVDRRTQERIPKNSFYWYKNVIAGNGRNLDD